jgi:hypothetical protein
MSKSPPESDTYLGCYAKAVRKMRSQISKKTLVRYEAKAKRWSAEKPSQSQQCQYVNFDSCRD